MLKKIYAYKKSIITFIIAVPFLAFISPIIEYIVVTFIS